MKGTDKMPLESLHYNLYYPLLDNFVRLLRVAVDGENALKTSSKAGSFLFLPLQSYSVFKLLGEALEKSSLPLNSIRFLDVGCGVGNVILIARALGINVVHGIEKEERYARVAQFIRSSIYYDQECKIFNTDALKFKNYGDYDIIYFYRPFCNNTKQIRLEERIAKQAKPGALILGVSSSILHNNKEVKLVGNLLYRKEMPNGQRVLNSGGNGAGSKRESDSLAK